MAAVDEARRTNEGPIRALAPIFHIALEPQRGQLLNVARAAAVLGPILGDNFSDHAFEAFLPQLVQLGWLVEEPAGEGRAGYRVPTAIPTLNENEAAEASEAKLDRLYIAFKEFLDINAPLIKLTLTSEQFKWQLFRWCTSLDGSDKQAVKSEAEKIVEGRTPSIRNAYLDEPQRFSKIDKALSVEFAAFVKWLTKGRRAEIDDVASLTELGLAVEFLEELRQPKLNSHEGIVTAFVLDAPVLLDLLGLSGPSRKKSIERCLNTLRDHGASIVTLPHCLEELSDVLKAVLERPQARRFGLTGDALRADPGLAARAQQVATQPDKAVKLVGVEMAFFDAKGPLNAERFPDELIDRFRNTISWHDQSKTEQRERDALSIAYVVRRRQGQFTSDIFGAKVVLVTRNSTFVWVAKSFVIRNLAIPEYAFGPAIETKTLAALVWMRFGSTAAAELPEMQLIAACDRILATNGELLRRAERKLKTLTSDDSAAALLSSQQAVLDLVIATGGSPEVLDAANGEELLRAFTKSAEARGRLVERKRAEKARAELTRAIDEKEAQIQKLEEKSIALAADSMLTEAKLRRREEELVARESLEKERVKYIASLIAEQAESRNWKIVLGLWAICSTIGIFGQFFIWRGWDWWTNQPSNLAMGLLVIACTVAAVAFGLRWVPGKIDLAATLHSSLVHRDIQAKLERIEPSDERRNVTEALEAVGAFTAPEPGRRLPPRGRRPVSE